MINIYIATYNRPSFLKECLRSVINQTLQKKFYRIIVSDNSTNNKTQELISNFFLHDVVYRKQENTLSAINHFQTILEMVNSEYFMIFHDDDLMLPHCLESLYNNIQRNSTLSAVASNAFIQLNQKLTNKLINPSLIKNTKIHNPTKLSEKYINIFDYIVPFSSYLYRASFIKDIKINDDNLGKYSDVAFLIKVCKSGSILWLKESLIIYRVHDNNDFLSEDLYCRLKLLSFIYKNSKIQKHSDMVNFFKAAYWFLSLKKTLANRSIKIKLVVIIFIIRNLLKMCILHPINLSRLLINKFYYFH
jgi:GT2 family glycosyltransferase